MITGKEAKDNLPNYLLLRGIIRGRGWTMCLPSLRGSRSGQPRGVRAEGPWDGVGKASWDLL